MANLNFSTFTLRARRGVTANLLLNTVYHQQGEFLYSTDDKNLYVSDGTTPRQVATTLTIVTKTGAYTITVADSVILCNTVGGAFTVTLPNANTCKGKLYYIKDTGSASANNITVATNGGNIDGVASKVINTAYGVLRVVSDGANWFTV